MIANVKDPFEQALQENLSLYIAPQELNGKDFFQCTREISIARFALNQQAKAYYASVEIWTELLSNLSSQATDAKTLTDINMILATIENKSRALIESSRQVTDLIGRVVSMDVDKTALRTMLFNLPSLVKDSITKITGNGELAENISLNLNNQISEMMIAFRFTEGKTDPSNQQQPIGISFEQLDSMVNSVPSQPQQ